MDGEAPWNILERPLFIGFESDRRCEMTRLTRNDVLSVIGPADEVLVTEIIATEATLEELTQAWAWVKNDEALINEGRALPSGRTGELIELLDRQDDDEEA
ncbi:MAG TPA: hypothetical protein VN130_02560 [Xanthobacteraceae bacterium]|nr:hypothetical protein [Xanthobacteraceae bacterium]